MKKAHGFVVIASVVGLGFWTVYLLKGHDVQTNENSSSLTRSKSATKRFDDGDIWSLFDASTSVYGTVFDQFGEPIDGAEVFLVVRRLGEVGPSEERRRLSTDSRGRFQVGGVSAAFMYLSARHPDYQRIPSAGGEKVSELTLHQFDHDAKGKNGRMYVTLYLHRVSTDSRVTHHELAIHSQELGQEPIEVEIASAIQAGSDSDKIVIDFSVPGEDDLLIASSARTWEGTYSWSVTTSVPGGGLALVESFADLEAPHEGYVPAHSSKSDRNDDDWRRASWNRYYIRLPSGRHGALEINTEIFRGYGVARVEMWINEGPGAHDMSGSAIRLR